MSVSVVVVILTDLKLHIILQECEGCMYGFIN